MFDSNALLLQPYLYIFFISLFLSPLAPEADNETCVEAQPPGIKSFFVSFSF
jgi:hypothetical protein